LLLVTIETNFSLRRGHQHRILSHVARVAISAGDFVKVMIVAVPTEASIRGVTIQAEAVLNIDRCRGAWAKHSIRCRALLATPYACGVIARRPVTSFALQLAVTKRSVRVSRICVCTFEQREDRFFLVTGQAGICAFATVAGILTVSRAGGQEQQHHRGDDERNESHSGNLSCSSSVESRVLYA
jgi:hypothetical protein